MEEEDFELNDFGIGSFDSGEPNYIENIKLLRDYCRLRYSQLMGRVCVIDTGVEGNSEGETAIDCQLDNEFSIMDHVYYQLGLENPLYNGPGYRQMADVLIKALFAFHQLAGLRPLFKFHMEWPPKVCIGEPNLDEEGVKNVLLNGINEAHKYLTVNEAKNIDCPLVLDYQKSWTEGVYDWVSFEPLV